MLFVYLGFLIHPATQNSPVCCSAITRVAMLNLDSQIWKLRLTISSPPSWSCIILVFFLFCLFSFTALSVEQLPREMHTRLMLLI